MFFLNDVLYFFWGWHSKGIKAPQLQRPENRWCENSYIMLYIHILYILHVTPHRARNKKVSSTLKIKTPFFRKSNGVQTLPARCGVPWPKQPCSSVRHEARSCAGCSCLMVLQFERIIKELLLFSNVFLYIWVDQISIPKSTCRPYRLASFLHICMVPQHFAKG